MHTILVSIQHLITSSRGYRKFGYWN